MKNKDPLQVQADLTTKATALLSQASEYAVVKDAESEERSVTFLGQVTREWNAIEATRKFFVKPLKDHAKTIDEGFKKAFGPLEEAERIVKEGIKAHRQSEEFKAAEKLRKTLEERGREAAQAGDTKELAALAEEHAEMSAIAPKTVATGNGEMRMRMGPWQIEVVNLSLVHPSFLMVDESEVKAFLRETEGPDSTEASPPGLKCWREKIPTMYST